MRDRPISLSLALALLGIIALPHVASAQNSPASSIVQSALDARLAAAFNSYGSAETIQQQIEEAERAQGTRPSSINLGGALVSDQEFVDHSPRCTVPPCGDPMLETAVANASLVIVGTVLSQRSLPTTNNSFLFTESLVRIDRLYQDDSHRLHPGDTVLVAREGGTAQLYGVTVHASTYLIPFAVGGSYLFALRPVPGTHAFFASANETFVINGDTVRPALGGNSKEHTLSRTELNDQVEAVVARKH